MLFRDTTGAYGGGGAPPTLGSGKSLTLNLGVLVQPYRNTDKSARAITTGDVAKILEAEYGVMEVFSRVHRKVIETALTNAVQGSLEALIMGRRVDPFQRGLQEIQSRFKQFISSYEAERVGIPGTPTKAALRGVNHRLKHPYRKANPRRPSFRDTGLYLASFISWVS